MPDGQQGRAERVQDPLQLRVDVGLVPITCRGRRRRTGAHRRRRRAHVSPRRAAPSDAYTAAVARELRSQRVAAGFTLVGLSERSGVPISTLNRLLQARRAITIAQLAALAPVFGMSPATLLTLAERRTGRQLPRRHGRTENGTP